MTAPKDKISKPLQRSQVYDFFSTHKNVDNYFTDKGSKPHYLTLKILIFV